MLSFQGFGWESDVDAGVVAYLDVDMAWDTEVEDIIVCILRSPSDWLLVELALLAVDRRVYLLGKLQSCSGSVLHQADMPEGVGGDHSETVDAASLTTLVVEEVGVNTIVFVASSDELKIIILHLVAEAIADGRTVATPISIGDILLRVLQGKL